MKPKTIGMILLGTGIFLTLLGINFLILYNPTWFFGGTDYFYWERQILESYQTILFQAIVCFILAGGCIIAAVVLLKSKKN